MDTSEDVINTNEFMSAHLFVNGFRPKKVPLLDLYSRNAGRSLM